VIPDAPDEVEDVHAGVGLSEQIADTVVDVVKAEVGVTCDATTPSKARTNMPAANLWTAFILLLPLSG
jgi:hypothetical protein